MPYDEQLAERVRKALVGTRGLAERKMFGGLCFLLGGHMCCGIVGRRLVARVGPEVYDQVLRRAHVRPMDFTGKPLRGFVFVMPSGLEDHRSLESWVGEGVRYACSSPKKRQARRGKGKSVC
ncbi:MAG: TfoX/Sxy family protein [Bryobacteraceae bacterium]